MNPSPANISKLSAIPQKPTGSTGVLWWSNAGERIEPTSRSLSLQWRLARVIGLGVFMSMANAATPNPVVRLTFDIEITSQDRICEKALAILKASPNITDPQVFLNVDGKPSVVKCAEVVFSSMRSPTNGYIVHMVGSSGQLQ